MLDIPIQIMLKFDFSDTVNVIHHPFEMIKIRTKIYHMYNYYYLQFFTIYGFFTMVLQEVTEPIVQALFQND